MLITNYPRVCAVIDAVYADIQAAQDYDVRKIAACVPRPYLYLRYLRKTEGPTALFAHDEAEALLDILDFPRVTHKNYSAFAEARNLLCLGTRFPKH